MKPRRLLILAVVGVVALWALGAFTRQRRGIVTIEDL